MVSKIISYGENREKARGLLIKALRETTILGLTTNKEFLLEVLEHPSFIDLSFTTHFIDNHFSATVRSERYQTWMKENEKEVFTVATLWSWNEKRKTLRYMRGVPSGFRNNRYANQLRVFSYKDAPPVEVSYCCSTNLRLPNPYSFRMKIGDGDEYEVQLISFDEDVCHSLVAVIDNVRKSFSVTQSDDNLFIHSLSGDFSVIKHSLLKTVGSSEGESEREINAEMPARILQINVKNGDHVKKGDVILVIESMKMQSRKTAPADGVVRLFVKESDLVDAGTLLVSID